MPEAHVQRQAIEGRFHWRSGREAAVAAAQSASSEALPIETKK